MQHRVMLFMACMVLGLLALSGQLYRLTVHEADTWANEADTNMFRTMKRHGARGMIYDSKGRPLATSEPAFAAVLMNPDPKQMAEYLPKLALILGEGDMTRAGEIAAWARAAVPPTGTYRPISIPWKLSDRTIVTLVERLAEFPGLLLVDDTARSYPQGDVAAQLLGYVGAVSSEDLEDEFFQGGPEYQGDEIIGKVGLERFYESALRGKDGQQTVTVDFQNRPVGDFRETPPQPGNNLFLTLDLELQRVAQEVLEKQIAWIKAQNDKEANAVRGSVVVQEVKTGRVLAMASWPSYDPNWYVAGLTGEQEGMLANGELINWAITPREPGSTYKVGVGLAGLELGAVGPYETIDCPAVYWRDSTRHNWVTFNEGRLDVASALARSCNPYFYEVGHQIGIDAMAEFLSQFGFGQPTGIDLPWEDGGILPTQESYGDDWHPTQVYSVAIGQGNVMVSPLQLANYTAAVAAGGERYRPYLVDEIRDPAGNLVKKQVPELVTVVQAREEHWRRVQEGMREAVTHPRGTAYIPFQGFPIEVAAKTGSAETGHYWANALTIAYAPYQDPEIAVSVIIDGGSKGSWVSPIARRVMAAYFGIDDKGKKPNTYAD